MKTQEAGIKQIGLTSAQEMLTHGPNAMHEFVADKLETSLGRALPQMEIRVKDLSLSADIVVTEQSSGSSKNELPTLPNAVKKAFIASKTHLARKEILKNVSLVFKPATITLVLGQPGSGKSSLMKILSGRFPMAKNIQMDGEVTYNGQSLKSIRKNLPQFAAYVNQRDKHYPMLTVKETLRFAHEFSGGEMATRATELLSNGTPEENAAALEVTQAMFQHYPDVVIEQLGLKNCENTIVGDAMIRGVSGGERKRVTTGEMEFGMKYVTFMDEISTGLDSAATYDIINTQRSIAKKLRKTIVVALLQPSPEVLSLFDNILIMNEGEVVYHGPREEVVDYFERLGFVCPPERDLADYLLDLGTSEQYRYQVPSWPQQQPRYASEYADLFRRSALYGETRLMLEKPHAPELLMNVEKHMEKMPKFHQSFAASLATLMRRELFVIGRNSAYLGGRVSMVVIMGLMYASIFYNVDPSNIQLVLGVMFASILFLGLGHGAQMPQLIAERDIFYKQRSANFFATSTYVLSNSLSRIPMAIMETLVFGSLVYWMCGFDNNIGSFIFNLIIIFLTNMVFMSWVFFVAALAPNANIGQPLVMLTVLIFIIFAGFIVTKDSIPDYFIWIYWISPVAWAHRAVSVIQYRSSTFDVCAYDGVNYCDLFGKTMGEYNLGLFGVPSEKYWAWYGMVVLACLYVLFMALSSIALEYKRYEAPENVTISSTEVEGDESYESLETPRTSPVAKNDTVIMNVNGSIEKNFVSVSIAFQDLWYSVPNPSNPKESIDLLKGISGYALPGSMTALMGSSGAGKTTLMDVIAGRKTGGTIRGKILLNGYEANELAIRRCTGYCEQMDIHSDASTFREALTFSAFLRMDRTISDSKKYDSVNEALDLLGMHDIADQIIRGSSVEQMKRLTIGVELAAQPSILFLDEPTSGLDARSAKKIMDGVRLVANTGRTVVCTIHQPSSEVFFLFDHLLLLKRGGQTVFFGDLGKNGRSMVEYFQSIPGVEPLPHAYNPAAWMLECIGAGVGNANGDTTDFVRIFEESEKKMAMNSVMDQPGVIIPSMDSPEMIFSKKRAANNWVQMKFLLDRFFVLYWRTPSYTLTRLVIAAVLALLFGLVFTSVSYSTYQGLNSGVGMIFIVSVFNGLIAFISVIPLAVDDRAAFYRERASQTYNALWYFVGSTIAEIPYAFASGLVFTAIFFPMVGFTGFDKAVLFWLFMSVFMLMNSYLGYLFSYAFPSQEVATIMGVTLNSIYNLTMGYSPPGNSIPEGYKWLYIITPPRYALSTMSSLVFGDCDNEPTYNSTLGTFTGGGSELGCKPLTSTPLSVGNVTVKQFLEGVYNTKHSEIWQDFAYMIVFVIIFRVLGLLALRYINHKKA